MALKLRAALNPFKDEFTDSTVDYPQSYREIFEGLGTGTKIENALIICEDVKIEPKDYDEIPDDNTRVYIRVFPEGTGSQMKDAGKGMSWAGGVLAAAGLVLSIATSWTGIGAAAGAALMGVGVSMLVGGATLLNADISSPSVRSKKSRASAEPDPMLKGGKNTKKPYGAIPVLFGKHLITPDYAADPFTTVGGTSEDGTNEPQWLTQLFCAGYSGLDIDLTSFKIGDTPLVNLSKTKDMQKILSGEDDYVKMSVQDGSEDAIEYFPKVIKEKQFNTQLKHLTDAGDEFFINYTTPENTTKIDVDIFFPYGLMHYNDNNDPEDAEVDVEVKWKVSTDMDIDANWKRLKKFSVKSSRAKTLRFSASSGIVSNGNQFDVKIRRITTDRNDDNKYVDDVYLGSIRCFRNDAPVSLEARKKCCLISLKTKASDFIEGVVDSLNFIATSKMPDYDGEGSGPEHWLVRATRNPASHILYVLRGQINGTPVADSDIDWVAFESFWKFCRDHSYFCNAVLNSDLTISELYSNIARIGRGTIVKRDQKFSVIYDSTKSSPVQLFTQRNTINYSQTIMKPDVPDQIDYEFIDESAGYQTNTRSIFNTSSGEKEGINPKTRQETSVWGITNAKQVFKFARYQQAVSNLRDTVHTIECDIEMLMCHQGDLIEYSGDTALRGLAAGRIAKLLYNESGLAIGLESDTVLPFEKESYAIRCRPSSGVLKTINVTAYGEGNTKTCYFSNPTSGLAEGDLFSFGVRENVTEQLIITGITPGDDLTATITAVDYAPEIFKVDDPSYQIPEFEQKLTVGGTIDDGLVTNPTEGWSTYTVYNDSREMPSPPIGVGQNGGWHSINTINSKWYSEKQARTIREGSWSAPRPLDIERDLTPPTTPAVSDITVSEYGNFSFSFGGSSDSQSGVKKYNVYINNILTASIDFDENHNQYGFNYETTRKNSKHKIFVTAVDNEGNESKPSEVKEAVSAVAVIPLLPTNLIAVASRQGINLSWSAPKTEDAALLPSRYIVEFSRDSGKTYTLFSDTSGTTALYRFRFTEKQDYPYQNEIDGYLEKESITEKYRFRVKSVSVYGNESAYLQQDIIDASSYLTWLIPEISTSAIALQNALSLSWSLPSEFYYEHLLFDVYKDGGLTAENMSARSFVYRFSEYLEKEDIEKFEFKVVVKSGVYEKEASFTIDMSGYLTYKIAKPEIQGVADKDGISLEWSRTNDFYGEYVYKLLLNGEEILSTNKTRHRYGFAEGLFPEKSDIEAMEFCVQIVSIADSSTSDVAKIDASDYLTYIAKKPTVYIFSSSRSASLHWDAQTDCYGFRGCDIQIARGYKAASGKYEPITDEKELVWYAPALGLNPYESLENYKRGEADGYLDVKGTSVSFSLPLFGQDGDGARDTTYAFRLRARTDAGKTSEWSDVYWIDARATSSYDVVKAWDLNDKGEKIKIDGALGVKQIFVEELSALSANLGVITDGGLVGSRYNYWAVNDTPMDDGSVLPKGSFRVGGSDQYILVKPRLDGNGMATGKYDITFNVGSLQISASGTRIDGRAFEVYDDKGNLMFSVSPEGSRIRVATGEFTSTTVEATLPDSNGIPRLPFISYDGNAYFVQHGTYLNHRTVQVWRLKPDRNDQTEMFMEVKSLLHSVEVSVSSACPIYAKNGRLALPARKNGSDGVLTINLNEKSSSFASAAFPNGDGALSCEYISVGGAVFIFEDEDEDKTLYYISGGQPVKIYSVTNRDPINFGFMWSVAEHNGFAYFAVRSGLFTIVLRVGLDNGACSAQAMAGVMKDETAIHVDDDAVSLFGAAALIGASGTAEEERFVVVKFPHATASWFPVTNGEPSPDAQRVVPDVWDFGIKYKGEFVGDNELVGIMPILSTTTSEGGFLALDSECFICSVELNETGAAENLYGYTLVGKASLKRRWEIPSPFDSMDDIEKYNLLSFIMYTVRNSFLSSVGNVDTLRVLSPFNANEESWLLKIVSLSDKENLHVTGGRTFSAGIGFNAIYFDAVSGKYRYYLDTGAYIEFDEDGNLVARGERGLPGQRGEKGASGASLVKAEQTKTSMESGGENIVTLTDGDGVQYPISIRNGAKGDTGEKGASGASLVKAEQTKTSTESGGENIVTLTDGDRKTYEISIHNGAKGATGPAGPSRLPTAKPSSPQKGDVYLIL